MNAFQFIDIKFQETSIKLSKMNSQSYDLRTGGEAHALQMILAFLRFLHKWLAVPRIVAAFIGVKLGISLEPVSPLYGNKPDEKKLAAVPEQSPEDARKHSDGQPQAQPGTP